MKYRIRILFKNGHLEVFEATDYGIHKSYTNGAGVGPIESLWAHVENGEIQFADVDQHIVMVRADKVE